MNHLKVRMLGRVLAASVAACSLAFAGSALAQGTTAAAPSAPGAGRRQPPLQVDPSNRMVNFGVVERGSVQHAKIKLKNTSGKPLRITRIKPDCSCTVATVTKKVLMAGEEITLDASLEVPRQLGVVLRGIHISCEGYNTPLTVTLRAEASFTVNVEPARIGRTKEMTGTLKVRSLDGQPFTILSAGGQPPVFAPDSPHQTVPAAEYVIAYDFPDLAPGVEIPAFFPIETDKAGGEYIDISVERVISAREVGTGLKPELPGINVGLVRPGDTVEVEMFVNGTMPELPLRAVTETSGFSIETVAGEDDPKKGIYWAFRVTVGPDAPEGPVFVPLDLEQDGLTAGIWLLAKVSHAPRPEGEAPKTVEPAPAADAPATPPAEGSR